MYETLKPVEISEYYINMIKNKISKYMYNRYFKPLFDVIKDKSSVINSKTTALEQALKSGRVYYEDNTFKSVNNFSNAVAKELETLGAKYRYGAYVLERYRLPFEIEQIISKIAMEQAIKQALINGTLAKLVTEIDIIPVKLGLEAAAEKMFKKLVLDMQDSIKAHKVPVIQRTYDFSSIKVSKKKQNEIKDYWEQVNKDLQKYKKDGTLPEWSNPPKNEDKSSDDGENSNNPPKVKDDELLDKLNKLAKENAPKIQIDDINLDAKTKKIAEDYVYNLEFYVKNWSIKDINIMRKDVLEMVNKGKRISDIKQYFEKRWKIAENKAKFLANNESRLASSVIKATELQDAGVSHFKWLRSSSKEKRKLHKEYYNKIFAFDNPPIIVEKTGQRGLPMQTYNCKCNFTGVITKEYWNNVGEKMNAQENIFTALNKAFNSRRGQKRKRWKYRRFE